MIRFSWRKRVALLLSVVPALGSSSAGTALAADTWLITDETVIEGVSLVEARHIRIADGGALRLRGVDLTLASWVPRPVSIRIDAGGVLDLAPGLDLVSGTPRLTKIQSALTEFEIENEGALIARSAAVLNAAIVNRGRVDFVDTVLEVGGSFVNEAGTVDIRGGRMHGGHDQLVVPAGRVSIADTRMSGAVRDLVRVGNADIRIEGSVLEDSGGSAIRAQAGANVRLEGSAVRAIGGFPLHVQGATAVVRDSTFGPSLEYTLRANESSLVFEDNVVDNHCGLYLFRSDGAAIRRNHLSVTIRGIVLYATAGGEIADNVVVGGSDVGIRVSGSAALVRGNLLEESDVGLSVSGPGLVVEGNRFGDHRSAVEVTAGGQPIVRHNSFTAGSVGLSNATSVEVDARWNWWGSASGPSAPGGATVSGPVRVDPWLMASPG